MEQGRFARFEEKPWSPCGLKSSLVSLCLDTKARLVQALLARLVEQALTAAAAIVDAAKGTEVELIARVTTCLQVVCCCTQPS